MKCVLLSILALTVTATTASAGGYLGLGIGPQAAVGDNQLGIDGDGRMGRILGGFRFSRLSLEGSYTAGDALTGSRTLVEARQASASGKLNIPLGSGFEVFGRAGLQRTWLSVDDRDGFYDVAGNGFLVGAGAEYRVNLVATSASIFLDYTYNEATVENDTYSYEFSTRQWMLGFTIGI